MLRRVRDGLSLAQAVEEADEIALIAHYKSTPVQPVFEVINSHLHSVVTGDPGAGKSALLKYLALRWADTGAGQIPIFIDLKEYGKTRHGFLKYCESGITLPRMDAVELDRLLREGKASLLLDGLDEVFDPSHRQSVLEEIVTASAIYPDAQIIVTSRKVGYRPEQLSSAGFGHVTLEDFGNDQISAFIQRWYLVAEDDEQKRSQMAARLSAAVFDNPSIRELAGNPLLLTMMAILNRSQELPRNRVALYRKATEVLLYEWDSSRALHHADVFDLEDKETMLRELAGDMQQEKGGLAGNLIERARLVRRFRTSLEQLRIPDSHNKALALVRQLQERNFILASAGGGFFSFVHRTFLEYFCAAWFVARLQATRELTIERLRDEVFGVNWQDEKWHQVLRLVVGMVSPQDAGVLIEYLISQVDQTGRFGNLLLAGACMYEVRNRRTIESIDKALYAEFQTALMTEGTEDGWTMVQLQESDWRVAAIHLMGILWRTGETLKWIQQAAEKSSSELVRWAAVQEVARSWSDEPTTLLWLKHIATSSEGSVASRAVNEIARSRMEFEIRSWMKNLARSGKNDWGRHQAIRVLAELDPEDAEIRKLILERAIEDHDWFVRAGALTAINWDLPSGPDSLEVVKFLTEDDFDFVRKRAIGVLAKKWDLVPDIVEIVARSANNDPQKAIRRYSLRLLKTQWPLRPEVKALEEQRATLATQLLAQRRSTKTKDV